MFERFTDRARRVVVLAQDESRMLHHDYIGTEHILLGLIHEGEGVAAKALQALDISLESVRSQVEEIVGKGQETRAGHIPFTPRAKKVLELSLRESLELGHDYIGTEHILLGLIREGDGVAAQVLVRMGADLSRVRHQVILVLEGHEGSSARREARRSAVTRDHLLTEVQNTLATIAERLTVIERHLGLPGGRESPGGTPAAAGDQPAPGGQPAASSGQPAAPGGQPAAGDQPPLPGDNPASGE
jgi:ATP-dependent Clp protease ATP-binding subunit ClpA